MMQDTSVSDMGKMDKAKAFIKDMTLVSSGKEFKEMAH